VTLIECVAAVAVIGIVLAAGMSLSRQAARLFDDARRSTQAVEYLDSLVREWLEDDGKVPTSAAGEFVPIGEESNGQPATIWSWRTETSPHSPDIPGTEIVIVTVSQAGGQDSRDILRCELLVNAEPSNDGASADGGSGTARRRSDREDS